MGGYHHRNRDGLTEREAECANLLAQGLSNRAIAAAMCINVKSVENKLNKVYFYYGMARYDRNKRVSLALMLRQRPAVATDRRRAG